MPYFKMGEIFYIVNNNVHYVIDALMGHSGFDGT